MFQVVQPFENNTVMMNLIMRMLLHLYISFHIQCIHSGHEPDIVVYAQSTDHVSQVVKYCASKRLPVIPFGTGTGLEGSVKLIITVYLFTSFLL
jgi:hypothetical protein